MTTKTTTAIGLALTTALISGVSNFVNKIAVSGVADPVVYTLIKNGLVAVLLVGWLVVAARWRELRGLSRGDWLKLVAIGVIGGSLPFALFFTGLSLTSAVSASLIHKMLFIWVAILAVPFLGERLGRIQWAAFGLLVLGNVALGGWQQLSFGRGELLIFTATLLWAVENIIAKRVLEKLSSTVVAAARMALGAVILLGIVVWQGHAGAMVPMNITQWAWTFVTATLLLAYVTTWYAALKRAPATLVASLLVPASLITNILSLMFQHRTFTSNELTSSVLVIVAVSALVWGARRSSALPHYATS